MAGAEHPSGPRGNGCRWGCISFLYLPIDLPVVRVNFPTAFHYHLKQRWPGWFDFMMPTVADKFAEFAKRPANPPPRVVP